MWDLALLSDRFLEFWFNIFLKLSNKLSKLNLVWLLRTKIAEQLMRLFFSFFETLNLHYWLFFLKKPVENGQFGNVLIFEWNYCHRYCVASLEKEMCVRNGGHLFFFCFLFVCCGLFRNVSNLAEKEKKIVFCLSFLNLNDGHKRKIPLNLLCFTYIR